MDLEIEAKFRVDDDQLFPTLLLLPHLGDFQLCPRTAPEDQHSTYFDTADQRLQTQGFSLRIRSVAGRRTATLKRTRRSEGAVRTRDEWSCPIGADDDPLRWPDSSVRAWVLVALDGQPLEPLFTVQTRRQIIHACLEGRPVAELCLDTAVVRAGAQAERFRELEVELCAPEARRSFDALLALLCRAFPLAPEQRSKKSRGLALRRRHLEAVG